MREKIEITNFAGIKHWEVELKAINILIGPQASGKSVTAKLFYFFKSVFSITKVGASDLLQKQFLGKKFETYFPPHTWGSESFNIKYVIDDFWIEIRRNKKAQTIRVSFSETFTNAFREIKSIAQRKPFNSSELGLKIGLMQKEFEVKRIFFEKFRAEHDNILGVSQFFIPAGRSFFANLQSNIFTLLSGKQVFDPILLEFGSLYEGIKSPGIIPLLIHHREESHKLDDLINNILHGKHVVRSGEDFLVHDNGRDVHINFASSGQQEALPLALFLKYIMRSRLGIGAEDEEVVVYIEEPEAHLFPQSQKSVVEALALIANVSKAKYQFIITTHSPYILASFNNLIEAGNVVREIPDKKEEVFKIVDKSVILEYEDVNAYSLKGGLCERIMDDEMRLISPTILDEVSNDISVQFGKLLDL